MGSDSKDRDMPDTSQLPKTNCASPDLVLATLREHVEPSLIFAALPTALNLFAHLQLLARQVVIAAQNSLDLNKKLTQELDRTEIPMDQWIRRGALKSRHGLALDAIRSELAEMSRDDRMFVLSLELRQHHLAVLLSNKSVKLKQSSKLLKAYFPDLVDFHHAARSFPCYIRAMSEEQYEIFNSYKTKVQAMSDMAENAYDSTLDPPTLGQLLPHSHAGEPRRLVEEMLSSGEGVVEDIRSIQGIFHPPSGASVFASDTSPESDLAVSLSPPQMASPNANDSFGSPPPIRAILPTRQRFDRSRPKTPHHPQSTRPSDPPPVLSSRSFEPRGTDAPTMPAINDVIPDFTRPSASVSSKFGKSLLRPFPDRVLVRAGQAVKRPRTSSTATADTGPDDDDSKRVHMKRSLGK